MTQKLTKLIKNSASPEMALSPIKSKRDQLLPVWIARNKKAARTRSRLKKLREAASAQAEAGEMEEAKAA